MHFLKDLRIWKLYKIIVMFIEIINLVGKKIYVNTDQIVSFNENEGYLGGTIIKLSNGETIKVKQNVDFFKKYYLKLEE